MSFRDRLGSWLMIGLGIGALSVGLVCLAVLLWEVISSGIDRLTWDFLTSYPSRHFQKAGIKAALWGTVWVMVLTAVVAIPLGIMSGVFLEEFAPRGWLSRMIRANIANLAGIPSVVYGIFGLAIFVRGFALGRSVAAGALTMALLVVPIIIMATMEALRSIPSSLRWGAYAVGATKRQVVWSHVLPEAMPGILTGIILALSRAVGEAAPLLLVGALSFVAFVPESIFDGFTVLAIQIFNWAGRPQDGFREIAAAGIIVLVAVTLSLNALAIFLRTKMTLKRSGHS